MEQRTLKYLIPGPVEVDPQVLAAMSKPVEPHYGDIWVKKLDRILTILKKVFNTDYDVFLMAGSGTCAIDACMGSALMTGEKIIIANNGFFGDRLVEVADNNGLKVVEIKDDWGKQFDVDKIKQAMKEHPDAKAVAIVHCETSTTIINPLNEIGALVGASDMLFIVDAVSSLGGMPFDLKKWNVDLCASATQKCIGAPPGMAPVAISPKAWKMIDRSNNKAHGWYTNLQIHRKYAREWGAWHPTPVTMPTNNVNALLVALEQLMEEGIENRVKRFTKLALQLRKGLREAGLEPYTPDDGLNPVLTAAWTPEGVSSADLLKYLVDEHGIQISSGLGDLKPRMIRVGHMTPVITSEDISRLIDAIKAYKS